eukprot:scpid44881/ scgid2076/ Gephyrin; Molybdopterin adenylyltransferase; Domain G; Molybdopterin molybdenumtransferase; Domain E
MALLKVGVLTVSDRCSRGEAEDTSGPNLVKLIREEFEDVETALQCVPDNQDTIAAALRSMCDRQKMRIVLTTGGTGLSSRDVTPEATRSVVERLAPGISTAMTVKSLDITPMAMLSRAVCGIRGSTLICNLPGSKKAAAECFDIIRPALQHANDLLVDNTAAVTDTHAALAGHSMEHHRTHGGHHHGEHGRHHHGEHGHHHGEHGHRHGEHGHHHGGHGHKHGEPSHHHGDHHSDATGAHQYEHGHRHHHQHNRHDDPHGRHHHHEHGHHHGEHGHHHEHHGSDADSGIAIGGGSAAAAAGGHRTHHHDCPHRSKQAGAVPVQASGRVARRERSSPFPMIPMDEAMSSVMTKATRLAPVSLPIADALGCVLAVDVHARDALPPFPASVKDGYAVKAADGSGERKVIGPVIAGDSPHVTLSSGEVARISTGACLPEGADAVVQVEDTELVEDADDGRVEVVVKICTSVDVGNDVRPVGFDIAQGERVLTAGCTLGSAEIGLLASIGVAQVDVHRKPVVGVLSTGNELCDPATDTLPGGHIRDSNRAMLMAAVREKGFTALDLGIAKDSLEALGETIRAALEQVDVLVTSGGVSMGEKDLLKAVLTSTFGGTLHFGRVHMKPGKPTTFVTIPAKDDRAEKLVFALPGNPVSALVTFHLFTVPALRCMSGLARPTLPCIHVKLSHRVKLDPRPEYQRCVVRFSTASASAANGQGHSSPYPEVSTTGSQCSSRLLSMRSANALLCLPQRSAEVTELSPGSIVQALLIGEL